MNVAKLKKDKKIKPKKGKKIKRLANDSDSGSEDEHELSYYLNDRVKLMKEVIQILSAAKIKSMAPEFMKDLDAEEINSILLEELLGISNKRVKSILNGQPQEDESSSTDEDEEKPPEPDIISLDDISDDDFVIDLDSGDDKAKSKRKNKAKVKEELMDHKKMKVKKEKNDKNKIKTKDDAIIGETSEEQLMSVLELLELQARARAIRSQLALESRKKEQEKVEKKRTENISDVDDAIIIESPRNDEIIITSSDSEKELSATKKNKKILGSKAKNSRPNNVPTDTTKNVDSEVNPTTSRNWEVNKSDNIANEGHDDSDVQIITSSGSGTSKISRSDNIQEIHKMLNKLHKMKKQKQKSALDKRKSDNRMNEKRCCRRKLEKLNRLNTECENRNNVEKELSITTRVDVSELNCGEMESVDKLSNTPACESNIEGNKVEKSTEEIDDVFKSSMTVTMHEDHSTAVDDDSVVNKDQTKFDMVTANLETRNTDNLKSSNDNSCKENQQCNIVENKADEQTIDDGEGIILNVDQSELDSINLDSPV